MFVKHFDWDILMIHFDETFDVTFDMTLVKIFLWAILIGHLYETVLWNILMKHFDETVWFVIWWHIWMKRLDGIFLWDILMKLLDKTVWWNILNIHFDENFWMKNFDQAFYGDIWWDIWWDLLIIHFYDKTWWDIFWDIYETFLWDIFQGGGSEEERTNERPGNWLCHLNSN